MAKSNAALKSVVNPVNKDLLFNISTGKIAYLTKSEAEHAGLTFNPPLVEINMGMVDPNDPLKVRCRLTPAGVAFLQNNEPVKENKTVNGFAIIDNAVLPPARRGGGGAGAPQKYPFDDMDVGQSFFVPVTDKVPNPVKSMASTISAAHMRFAVDTGRTKVVERSKRGAKNKLVLDNDGNKIMETKEVPVYEFTRKFSIRGVEAGKTYGGWVAPEDGALIARVK